MLTPGTTPHTSGVLSLHKITFKQIAKKKKVNEERERAPKTLFSKFSPPPQSLLLLLLRLAVFRGETFDWRLYYTFAAQTQTTHLNATFLARFCFLPFFAFCDDLFSSYIHGVLLPLSSLCLFTPQAFCCCLGFAHSTTITNF